MYVRREGAKGVVSTHTHIYIYIYIYTLMYKKTLMTLRYRMQEEGVKRARIKMHLSY